MNRLNNFIMILTICVISGCGNDSINDNNVAPDADVTLQSNITPYTGTNPYDKVSTFIGTSFKDNDPDLKWLTDTKAKLTAMKYGEHLSQNEYTSIVQRQTQIQSKFDSRNDYYNQLKNEYSATILPHTAVEFELESFCLNINMHSPTSGSSYDQVVPIEEHIKKILTWNYTDGKSRLDQVVLQGFIWDIQDYVHNGYDYESAFTGGEKEFLKEIFGTDDKSYLDQMKEKYGPHAAAQNKTCSSRAPDDREGRLLAKTSDLPIGSLKNTSTANSSMSDFFNLGNGLIGKFSSSTSFSNAKLLVINPTDKPLNFKPMDFMLQTAKTSSIQPIALGVMKNDLMPNSDDDEIANRSLPVEDRNPDQPNCNISDQHRDRIIEESLPGKWAGVPYQPNNSRTEGVVCNQYVRMVYNQIGLPFSETNTWGLPKSPYFEKIPTSEAHNGDIVLWLNSTTNPAIHHMGLWVEHPEQYGGTSSSPFLSARTHNGRSSLPTNDPNFKQTVDWSNPNDFGGHYDVYRYKGAGKDAPTCPVK